MHGAKVKITLTTFAAITNTKEKAEVRDITRNHIGKNLS
jgi:hypothetical protein